MQPKKHTLPHAACLDNDIHGPARSRRREYGVPYAHGRPDQRHLHLRNQKPSAVLRSTHTDLSNDGIRSDNFKTD